MTMSYSQHVGVEEMRRCLERVRELMNHLKPGFLVLTDLTNMESMDPSCAPVLGAIMDLSSERGMATVVRVIPDPYKEIGFNLLSHFHLHPQIKIHTHENLAQAIKSLLAEAAEAVPIQGNS